MTHTTHPLDPPLSPPSSYILWSTTHHLSFSKIHKKDKLSHSNKNEWLNQWSTFCTNELCTNETGIMQNMIIYSLPGGESCRDIQRQLKHCCEFSRLQLQRLLCRGGHFCNFQVQQARPSSTGGTWARKGMWFEILWHLNLLTLPYSPHLPTCKRGTPLSSLFSHPEATLRKTSGSFLSKWSWSEGLSDIRNPHPVF